jgi:signal transduction histidine kinase/CheY-like chemotaxis protein
VQVIRYSDRRAERHPAFLTGGGEMGELLRSMDWSGTSLGPLEQWPQSLRSAVSILLPSRAQICLFWGPDLCAIYNDAYRPTLGIKHPRALGQPAREVWREFWNDVLRPLLAGVVETGEAFWGSDYPFFLQRHGYPEETYFDVSYDPVRDESGKVGGVFCIVSETTGRVLGERRLGILRDIGRLASEALGADDAFRRVANVLCDHPRDLPFALFYAPAGDGTIGCVAACNIEPMPADAWPLARIAAERQEVLLAGDELAAHGSFPGTPWPEPARAVGILPIAVAGEAPLGFLVAGVSPRRPLDDGYRDFLRLVASNIAAVVSTARALEEERKRAEALAELDRAKTTFFSNVSHEFRTPLTLMLGPLEDVLNDPAAAALSDRQRERLELAQRNSLRLLRLVNTLLDFSRIEAGRIQASYVPTDLALFTADLASGFRSAIERAGLSLQVDCAPLPEPVHVDRDMWEKVVLNLLSNALKFTFDGGIAVALQAKDGRAVLSVRDTGVGVPSAELPRLFERFHRIQGQRSRSFEGSGIGLALVHELVRLHGGTIAADSTENAGTTFTVAIPFGTAHLPAGQIGASPTQVSTATRVEAFVEEALRWLPDLAPAAEPDLLAALTARVGDDRKLVLLADDNADMRDYVHRLLAQHYRVVSVPDGAAALEVMHRTRPDLLLADVMMPVLDGFGLLRAVRAEPALRDIPVVLLSARAGEEARLGGLDAGADDYLIKPFSARELLARIGANLTLAQVRREATEAALDSAERLREMFAQAPGFMCMLRGPEHVFELANDAYARVVGPRRLIGLPVREVFPELADQGYFELLDQVYRTGKPYAGTAQRLLLRREPDAPLTERFVDFVYQPIRDGAGAVSGIFVEGVEVTERVLAERALREAN